MRNLIEAREKGDERAVLAIEVFCYRLAKSLAVWTVPYLSSMVYSTGGIRKCQPVQQNADYLRLFDSVMKQ